MSELHLGLFVELPVTNERADCDRPDLNTMAKALRNGTLWRSATPWPGFCLACRKKRIRRSGARDHHSLAVGHGHQGIDYGRMVFRPRDGPQAVCAGASLILGVGVVVSAVTQNVVVFALALFDLEGIWPVFVLGPFFGVDGSTAACRNGWCGVRID